ncbi:prolyl oligopeptidase PreP (S9A serine peptidase family) [Bradyrhizobium japonicum]
MKKTPSAFDASNHVVEQLEATSPDGTSISYFLVRPKNARFDGAIPTLLYGYGGFQVSLRPSYLGPVGRLWLEQGKMLMSLRTCAGGGGEFGPQWHQAAQGATKQTT